LAHFHEHMLVRILYYNIVCSSPTHVSTRGKSLHPSNESNLIQLSFPVACKPMLTTTVSGNEKVSQRG
jgi:hypothetical protein